MILPVRPCGVLKTLTKSAVKLFEAVFSVLFLFVERKQYHSGSDSTSRSLTSLVNFAQQ